jgi:F-type H+-transporting ATPase subunit delta
MSFIRPLLRSPAFIQQVSKLTRRSLATEMQLTFSSPAEVLYNQSKNVKQIDVPTLSGDFGILANHVPTLAVLKPGVVTVHEDDGKSKKFFVSSGSVTVNADSSVQILAEEAFSVDKLDLSAAQQQLVEAQRFLQQAKDDKEKAEAQIQIECIEAVIKALQSRA